MVDKIKEKSNRREQEVEDMYNKLIRYTYLEQKQGQGNLLLFF